MLLPFCTAQATGRSPCFHETLETAVITLGNLRSVFLIVKKSVIQGVNNLDLSIMVFYKKPIKFVKECDIIFIQVSLN